MTLGSSREGSQQQLDPVVLPLYHSMDSLEIVDPFTLLQSQQGTGILRWQ
jgi:hypothetical protein